MRINLTLFGDDWGSGLRRDYDLDDLQPKDLGLSSDLIEKLDEWHGEWGGLAQLSIEQWESRIGERVEHELRGLELAEQMQQQLGEKYYVRLWSNLMEGRVDPKTNLVDQTTESQARNPLVSPPRPVPYIYQKSTQGGIDVEKIKIKNERPM